MIEAPHLTPDTARGLEPQARRIAYFMHVDWRWIKQRPHFLAEYLALRHDIRVFYRLSPNRVRLPQQRSTVARYPLLPLPWNAPFASLFAHTQQRWVARANLGRRPNLLWLTHPSLLTVIPHHWHDIPVVYDCMDDVLEFSASEDRRRSLASLERQLVRRSAHIFCSSVYLVQTITSRYGDDCASRTTVVHNAVSDAFLRKAGALSTQSFPRSCEHGTSLAYAGTIDSWLDVDSLNALLSSHPSLTVHLIGPLATHLAKSHPHLHYHGPAEHDVLADMLARFDAYVMPFSITPLIRSVDPVKLYEYIALGKPILCPWYAGLERFSEFVYFYSSRQELHSLVARLITGELAAKGTPRRRHDFLASNTWACRTAAIEHLLSGSPA